MNRLNDATQRLVGPPRVRDTQERNKLLEERRQLAQQMEALESKLPPEDETHGWAPPAGREVGDAPTERRVYFSQVGGVAWPARGTRRAALAVGMRLDGQALVEEPSSTALLRPRATRWT